MGHQLTGSLGFKNLTYSPSQIRTHFKFFRLATRMLPKRECSATYTTLMALRSRAILAKCCDAMLKRRAVRASRFTLHRTSSFSTSHLRNLASDRPLSISGATLTSPPEMSLATFASRQFAPSNKSGSRSSTHSTKILQANRKSIFVTMMLSPLPTR